jgi:hypothetical protein
MATAKGVQIALYGFRVLLVLMILLDCMVKSPLAGLAFVQPSTLSRPRRRQHGEEPLSDDLPIPNRDPPPRTTTG